MQLFYIPNITGDRIILDETESKHSVKVLRLSYGDNVNLIDGKGGFYDAEIIKANPKKCELQILKTTRDFGKRNFKLHIAIAPTKNIDRFEWFLEKATEIGIDEITPILTEQSERKTVKPERLVKIMISAMKQSLKAYLPTLNQFTSFSEFIHSSQSANKYIAHCNEGKKSHFKSVIKQKENILVLIGPEGDFSVEEVKRAKKSGFAEISLGNSRLRTETAGIVACHIANLANE